MNIKIFNINKSSFILYLTYTSHIHVYPETKQKQVYVRVGLCMKWPDTDKNSIATAGLGWSTDTYTNPPLSFGRGAGTGVALGEDFGGGSTLACTASS